MLTLTIEKRIKIGKGARALRAKGQLPAVYYGKKQPSTPITVQAGEFLKVWKQAGESTVVTLSGEDGPIEALIHDIDRDPVTDTPVHIDFYVFEKGQELEISVPIVYQGTAPALKELGGILVKVLHELKIKAQPKDLPHEIIVDIAPLTTFDSQILAKDIPLGSGVTLAEKPDEVVVSVTQPIEEKEEEVAPIDMTNIEISEQRGKEEEPATPEGEPSAKKKE